MRKRNLFNLSNEVVTTFDPGELIPLDWWQIKPGDTIQGNSALLIRSLPLLAPMFATLVVRLHYWFCPLRLIWEDSEDFFTGGADGTSTPEHPYFQAATMAEGSLMDYMGMPVAATYGGTISYNCLPFRALNLIWNEHYRDQDLATERAFAVTSGSDGTTDVSIPRVAWPKDYLTTCRPWQQKGTAVTIPLGDDAPVTGLGVIQQTGQTTPANVYYTDGSAGAGSQTGWAGSTNASFILEDSSNSGYPDVRADLSSATGIDITDLNESIALQRFMEDMARGGSRYTEYLRMHLGIRGSDARLQIPEYLGGGKQVMSISEVLATDGANTGLLKGHGIGALQSNKFRKFFEEHGIMMALISVTPKPVYMNGIPRKFSMTTKEDYYQHQLEHIGEQEVLNKEVYAEHGTPDGIFGYQARYDHLRTESSKVSGEMNSTLNHYHMARDFGSSPALNETFIECTPTNRNWLSTGTNKFTVRALNRIAARRILSKRATTKILG